MRIDHLDRPHEPTQLGKGWLERDIQRAVKRVKQWETDEHVYLRQVDAGTNHACWVVCAKGDPGAVKFVPALG